MAVLDRPSSFHRRWLVALSWFVFGATQACAPTPCTCVCQVPSSPGGTSKPAASRGNQAAEQDDANSGARVVWDGDGVGQGAKGWADCERKPKCSSSLIPSAGAGKGSSTGLVWQGEGAGWVGAGWNLFGWWPQDAGLDVSGDKTLRMLLRVAPKGGPGAAAPRSISVALKCSTSKACESETVEVSKYAEGDLLDGKWHPVIIPLSKLTSKKGFDSTKVWELDFNTWSESASSFSVYVDNIAFGN